MKRPPFSKEAEEGILGCLLLDPSYAMPRTADRVKKDDFHDLRNQDIYRSLVDLWGAGVEIDLISVSEDLRKRKRLGGCGGLPRLSAIQQSIPSASNIDYYIDILKEKAVLRSLIYACGDLSEEAYAFEGKEVGEFIGRAEQKILSVAGQAYQKMASPIKEVVIQTIEDMDGILARDGQSVGIETQFSDFDHWTGGLHPGELVVVAARPSVGKTSWCMNIAERLAVKARIPVGIFSLEMTAKSLVQRMISSLGSVDSSKFRRGGLTQEDIKNASDIAARIAQSPLYIDDDSSVGILEIRARARRWLQDHKIKLIVIDYFQLITGRRRERSHEDLAEISHGIKAMAKELKIPTLLVSQISREFEKEVEREPRLSDLRGTGDLEQDADTVLFLWHPKKPTQPGVSLVHAKIAKQRNGPTAKFNLKFSKPFTRFESFHGMDAIQNRVEENDD